MISNKPYILRAFYDWILDNRCTPILVINVDSPHCRVPLDYVENGEIVFNIAPAAVRGLKLNNDAVEFKATFNGIVHMIYAPVRSIGALYAEENGEGVYFDSPEDSGRTGADAAPPVPPPQADNVSAKRKPFLRLVE
jgi:stringent starvation protein B